MTKIYIAFYDREDDGARENWNTFYTPWVASTSYSGAEALAKKEIKEIARDYILDEFGVDINIINIDDITDEGLREEVRNEYDYHMNDHIIEIQEGELELNE